MHRAASGEGPRRRLLSTRAHKRASAAAAAWASRLPLPDGGHAAWALAGAAAGAAAALWLVHEGFLPSPAPGGAAGVAVRGVPAAALAHPAAGLGLPSPVETLRVFRGHVVAWDGRTRNPAWVAERLTRDSAHGAADRAGEAFREDAGLAPRFRSRLEDFRASGFDRGHMAAAANHKADALALRDTFVLSNVSPQWARIERWAKELTSSHAEVFVVTGPLWLPAPLPPQPGSAPAAPRWAAAYPLLGTPPRLVAVPTHFFKAVAVRGGGGGGGGGPLVAAFVVPNAPQRPDTPLTAYAVPLHALEEAAGFELFPALLGSGDRGGDRRGGGGGGAADAGGGGGGPRDALRDVEARWIASLPHRPALGGGGDAAQLLLPPPPPQPAPQPAPQLLLEGPPAPLALPPPPAAASGGAPAAQPPPGRRPGGAGPQPLCAVTACALPAANWWAANAAAKPPP